MVYLILRESAYKIYLADAYQQTNCVGLSIEDHLFVLIEHVPGNNFSISFFLGLNLY